MHAHPNVWYCDVCGQPSVDEQNGYVIWTSDTQGRACEFKIIHKSDCDIDQGHFHSSNPISKFVGVDGLAYLLTFLSFGSAFPSPQGGGPRVANLDEFVDFFRRCQTPLYEEARTRFHHPDFVEDFGDSNELRPYLQDSLRRICSDY